METFNIESKVDLTILVNDFGNTRIMEKCLLYMFDFQCVSIHVSGNDAYDHNSVIKNSIYHEFVSNFNGVHWDVKVGKYRIVGNNLIQCSQGTILTPRIAAPMENVVLEAFIVKQKVSISSSHFPSSTFIDLNDSFDEDVCLPVSFEENVFGSFLASISNMYLVEDVLSNLNQVQGRSSKIVIECLKAMSIAPHS
jgi:hypothetical protein